MMLRSFLRFLFVPGARLIEDDFAERLEANLADRKAKREDRQARSRKGWATRRARDRRAA